MEPERLHLGARPAEPVGSALAGCGEPRCLWEAGQADAIDGRTGEGSWPPRGMGLLPEND